MSLTNRNRISFYIRIRKVYKRDDTLCTSQYFGCDKSASLFFFDFENNLAKRVCGCGTAIGSTENDERVLTEYRRDLDVN